MNIVKFKRKPTGLGLRCNCNKLATKLLLWLHAGLLTLYHIVLKFTQHLTYNRTVKV